MKKRSKKIISILLMTLMLACTTVACGTEKLDGAQETQTASVEKKENEAEKPEKDEISEDEFFDVDSAEDDKTDYSKYDEKKTTEKGATGGTTGTNGANGSTSNGGSNSGSKPAPVNPGSVDIDTSTEGTCYLQISCATILNNMSNLTPGKEAMVPSNGIIFAESAVTFYPGESVYDVLKRETRNNRIHLEANYVPVQGSVYVEGINNLYEFDCGELSGWNYFVNGWSPNYGCDRYAVKEGDVIHWEYTCDQGRDTGADW